MKWLVACIGKPRLAHARLAIDDYLERARHYAPIEFLPLRAGPSAAEEGRQLLDRSEGCHRLVLDERGERLTSAEFARLITDLERTSVRRVAVLVGGADGHTADTRGRADRLLSLSSLTLQHELALVVLLEQIYRGYSILRGSPYHRE